MWMSAGLKFGMYSDAGERTCLGYPGALNNTASKPDRFWNAKNHSPKVHRAEGSQTYGGYNCGWSRHHRYVAWQVYDPGELCRVHKCSIIWCDT